MEIDLNKHLQSRFVLRKRVYTVEYEGLEVIYFKCGMYGHNQTNRSLNENLKSSTPEQGPLKKQKSATEPKRDEKPPVVSTPGIAIEEEYGAWMQV